MSIPVITSTIIINSTTSIITTVTLPITAACTATTLLVRLLLQVLQLPRPPVTKHIEAKQPLSLSGLPQTRLCSHINTHIHTHVARVTSAEGISHAIRERQTDKCCVTVWLPLLTTPHFSCLSLFDSLSVSVSLSASRCLSVSPRSAAFSPACLNFR